MGFSVHLFNHLRSYFSYDNDDHVFMKELLRGQLGFRFFICGLFGFNLLNCLAAGWMRIDTWLAVTNGWMVAYVIHEKT